jgi:hypothetical protein
MDKLSVMSVPLREVGVKLVGALSLAFFLPKTEVQRNFQVPGLHSILLQYRDNFPYIVTWK